MHLCILSVFHICLALSFLRFGFVGIQQTLDFNRQHIQKCIMFAFILLQEDALVLNEYRDDLRTECEKFGQVKKVIIFDVSLNLCSHHASLALILFYLQN